MRPWQRWFWRRDAQLLLWLVIVLFLGWLFLGPPLGGPRWWWPFERPIFGQGADPSRRSLPMGGWTGVAKAAMPTVVNIASARLVWGGEGEPVGPFFVDSFFRFFFRGPEAEPRR